jgi:hypothetical protein
MYFWAINRFPPSTAKRTMAAPPHALEVTPESALQFVLSRDGDASTSHATDGSDSTAKCTMTLRHTGQTAQSIAFKVRSVHTCT